jgi:hypothetical protein
VVNSLKTSYASMIKSRKLRGLKRILTDLLN